MNCVRPAATVFKDDPLTPRGRADSTAPLFAVKQLPMTSLSDESATSTLDEQIAAQELLTSYRTTAMLGRPCGSCQ
jgi:hypothetical protein